ncbi:unnamed protein product, partial [Heligmosomoides polygyrus]|uniref:GIT domain-containing protein n=1 Tax=Heligmosomoides polygyrus TaxID=6339 RepID=A0A183FN03_HELPZ
AAGALGADGDAHFDDRHSQRCDRDEGCVGDVVPGLRPHLAHQHRSAHSRLTPQARSRSPTISDVIRFRNRIGVLSDFLRNPRHKAPKPTVRSDSNASTQQGDPNSSGSEAK